MDKQRFAVGKLPASIIEVVDLWIARALMASRAQFLIGLIRAYGIQYAKDHGVYLEGDENYLIYAVDTDKLVDT